MPFELLSTCALFGLLANFRQWRRYLLYYALFSLMTASMMIFYVSDRQRLAMLPVFVIFATTGVARILTYAGRTRIALAGCMLIPGLLFSLPRVIVCATICIHRFWNSTWV